MVELIAVDFAAWRAGLGVFVDLTWLALVVCDMCVLWILVGYWFVALVWLGGVGPCRFACLVIDCLILYL